MSDTASRDQWQITITVGPCSPVEAQQLHDDIVSDVGYRLGASYALDKLDEEGEP